MLFPAIKLLEGLLMNPSYHHCVDYRDELEVIWSLEMLY